LLLPAGPACQSGNISNFIGEAKTALTLLLFRGWTAGPNS